MATLEERIQRLVQEEVAITAYDPAWPEAFRREKEHLLSCLPHDLIRRVEHFGSTAVPGLAAKPIVDVLVEVTDLEATRVRIAPVLEAQGYEYFWRPTRGDHGPPFYAWFIKRAPRTATRTYHIHMVEGHFTEHWDRLFFRDYLIEHPEVARAYAALKIRLASESSRNRVAYTEGKTDFVRRVTAEAKRYYATPERPAGAGVVTWLHLEDREECGGQHGDGTPLPWTREVWHSVSLGPLPARRTSVPITEGEAKALLDMPDAELQDALYAKVGVTSRRELPGLPKGPYYDVPDLVRIRAGLRQALQKAPS